MHCAPADAVVEQEAPALPQPHQLAALGAVLCLYRPQGGELGGWAKAVHAAVCSGVDSDGVRERLLFFDRTGDCCWRLYLLPDSNFLAWDRLAATVPVCHERGEEGGIGERLLRRLAGRLRGECWQGSALCLHALPVAPGFGQRAGSLLAASMTRLSALGASAARRIARSEGAGAECLGDECCCERSAAAAAHGNAGTHRRAGPDAQFDVYPLLQMRPAPMNS